MQFSLNPVTVFSTSQEAKGELAACTLTVEDLNKLDYVGLDLMVCINTNPLSDPTCQQGEWVTVVNGACLQETVITQVALQDYGDRLLVRVGGPGNLTACQPQWTLAISRTNGDCFETDPGYGTCCDLTCMHGERLTQTCFCFCEPGFTGTACDIMLPYLQVDLVLGNTTLDAWLAFSGIDTRAVQAANRLSIRSVLADALQLEIFYVEFRWASDYSAHRRGLAPDLDAGQSGLLDQAAGAERRAAAPLEAGGGGGGEGKGQRRVYCSPANFVGQTTLVSVRVIQTMEHKLFYLRRALAAAQGNLTARLAARGAHFCLFGVTVTGYSAYGSLINTTEAVLRTSAGLDWDTALLIVFSVVGGLVVLGFAALHVSADYAQAADKTRFLREHNPVRPSHKQGLAWRYEDPATRLLVAYPGDVSARLQRAFMVDWMEDGRPTLTFAHDGKEYEADFRTMAVAEAPPEGIIIEVQDRCLPRPRRPGPRPNPRPRPRPNPPKPPPHLPPRGPRPGPDPGGPVGN